MMIYTGIILLELVLVEMNFVGLFRVIQGNKKQAGADLCQAQYKLGLVKFWFGSVASCQNHNSTSTLHNITQVGFDMKMTLHPHHPPTHPPHNLNVSNISAVTELGN